MKFYRHPSTGYYDDYFGNTSIPVKISFIKYCILKAGGFRVTNAPNSYTIGQVHIKAQIESGSHPNSLKVNNIRNHYNIKEKLHA